MEGFLNWYCIIEQNSFIPHVLTRGIELYLEAKIPENIEGFLNWYCIIEQNSSMPRVLKRGIMLYLET